MVNERENEKSNHSRGLVRYIEWNNGVVNCYIRLDKSDNLDEYKELFKW